MNQEKQIDLPAEVLVKAQRRARSLGMTLAEYVQSLVDKDVATKEHDPWREPIPNEVDAMWEKDLVETEQEEQQSGKPRKTYYSADEYIKDMQDNP